MIEHILNALSLAAGLTAGTLLSYYITRREIMGMAKQLSETEFSQDFKQLIKKANELLRSQEAKKFFQAAANALEMFVESQTSHSEPLINLPPKPKIGEKEHAHPKKV